MTHLQFLMTLLPVVFMIHDFEEVIMFRSWLERNRKELKTRFPKVEVILTRLRFFELSTPAFSVAVAHEFLLLSIVSLTAVFCEAYEWWFAAFMAFFLHLFVHVAQWVTYRKYVPVIITSIAALPYCVYTFMRFEESAWLTHSQMFLWTAIGVVLTILSFPSAFYFARKFDKWDMYLKQANK